MHYVGRDQDHYYLKCAKCGMVQPYPVDEIRKSGHCSACGSACRRIWFLPHPLKPISILLFMLSIAAPGALLWLLTSCPLLLESYRFNRIMIQTGPLLISIVIPVTAAVISLLPSFKALWNGRGRAFCLFMITVMTGFILALFIGVREHYSTLTIFDEETGKNLQYYGSVALGQASGTGRIFDSEGNLIYSGRMRDGYYHGTGRLYTLIPMEGSSVSRLLYEGSFADGKYEGQGRLYDYTREYISEKPEDVDPHLIYEGSFVDGQYCGQGILYKARGSNAGGFAHGKLSGYCVNRWSEDGIEYLFRGTFLDGLAQGQCQKYRNGTLIYEGFFKDNNFINGKKFFNSGTAQYDGEFRDNKYDGYGKEYYPTGALKYEGRYTKGQFDGEGTHYLEDGTVQTGLFKKGEYVYPDAENQ